MSVYRVGEEGREHSEQLLLGNFERVSEGKLYRTLTKETVDLS